MDAAEGSDGLTPTDNPFRSLQPTRGRRRMAVGSFVIAIVAALGLFGATFSRWRTASDAFDGYVPLGEIHDADGIYRGALVALVLVDLATALCVGWWALRVVDNAREIGVRQLDTNWAMFGWCVPMMWYSAGFHQLALATDAVEGRAPHLRRWQLGFVVQTALTAATILSGSLFRQADDAAQLVNATRLQWIFGALALVATFVSAVYATRALDEISRAVVFDENFH